MGDSSRHAVRQELLMHFMRLSSSYPFGNAPIRWLQISSWPLTIRVPKWLGLRNLQTFKVNIYFLLWSRALVNFVGMNQILALDAAVLRWDPSVPSMFGSSLAIAWSDRLSAKQPQMFELASRLMITSNLSKIPTETEFWVPQHQFPWLKETDIIAKIPLKPLQVFEMKNFWWTFSVGLEAGTSPNVHNYKRVQLLETLNGN